MDSFARGGLINGLTRFMQSNGRQGKAGESGPEVAIAPLVRTPQGNLGVESVGGGGNISNTYHFSPNIILQGGNATVSGIRRSIPQLQREFQRSVQGG